MRRLPPYRVLFNNDTTNVGGCISPWRAHGETFNDERLVASIEEAADAGADCIVHCCSMGWIPWWKSSVYNDHYQWWMAKTGLQPDQYGRYMLDGGDMIATSLAACRRLGVGCMLSLRLNDVHSQENYLEKNPRSIWVSRFYEQNLDLMIDPEHKKRSNYDGRRGLDWGSATVRAYKLALVREMVAYDVDGIELDFLRDNTLFKDATPLPERARLMAGFAADVRAALDAGRAGRWLSVRIPLDPSRHAESGIDAEMLRASGVDMFNLSGWYHTIQRTEGLSQVIAKAPGAATYFELTHSTANHPFFQANNSYGTTSWPRTADNQFYSTARLALKAGAHGISLFNFVYYRHIQGNDLDAGISCEPPFHVMRHLVDDAWVARLPGLYLLGSGTYFHQVPRMLTAGKAEAFHLELAEHANATGARLRVHLRQPPPVGAKMRARLNGTDLAPSPLVHRLFGYPFDSLISPEGNRCAFTFAPEVLRAGANALELTWEGAQGAEIVYIDLGVDVTAPAAGGADRASRGSASRQPARA